MFGGGEITVTQTQVDGFINEFDNNMFPKERDVLRPASRDGPTCSHLGAPTTS